MPRLPTSPGAPSSSPFNPSKYGRKQLRRLGKAIMRSYRFRIPKYDLPIRLRPWFLVFTTIIMITLAFLGFTNFSRSLPLNDKLLHFICLGLATGVFYFIFDVEEDARRIWYWRHGGMIFTGVVCMLFGGIVSEVVQSLLPYKEFQMGDVVANLLGSAIGLYVAFHLERYYRHRREISRLYRPLADEEDSVHSDSEDEDDLELGTQLLPTHYSVRQPRPGQPKATSPKRNGHGYGHSRASSGGGIRLSNVWDEREELFGIGEDEDEGEEVTPIGPKIIISGP